MYDWNLYKSCPYERKFGQYGIFTNTVFSDQYVLQCSVFVSINLTKLNHEYCFKS